MGRWPDYVRDNVSLSGLSGADGGYEAILFDKQARKTHVLKVGEKMQIVLERDQRRETQDLTLDSVDGKEAVVSDGNEKVTVRPMGTSTAAHNQ